MASPGQVEYIEDLLERHGLSREDLAEEDPAWARYESLPVCDASELLSWLEDRRS